MRQSIESVHRLSPATLIFALWLMTCGKAAAGEIANGDFAAGLDDWFAESTIGTVSAVGGLAILEDSGGGAAQAFVPASSLSQAFMVSADDTLLSFDFAFSTSSTTNDGTDTFAVSIVSDDFTDPFVDILFVDDGFGVQADPFTQGLNVMVESLPPISGFAPLDGRSIFGRVALELPEFLLGDALTLFFDLNDNDLDPLITTRAAIDNVSLAGSVVEVAEPTPHAMILGSLLILMVAARNAPHKQPFDAKSA